jgi:hypothetical protein
VGAERVELMGAVVQVTFFADKIAGAQKARMPRAMAAVATEYANKVKLLMRDSPATGREYRRGSVVHRASAPGEPPAPDTGDLVRHVMWRVRSDGERWFAEVGNDLPYALYLEYGAARGVRNKAGKLTSAQWVLFPRPAWGPALEALRLRIPALIAKFGKRGA